MEAKAIRKSGVVVPAKVHAWLLNLANVMSQADKITCSTEITDNETNVCLNVDGSIVSINLMNIGGCAL